MALEKIVKNPSGVPTGEYEEIAGGTLYADVGIGTILPYGGTSDKIPQGFLLCNGAEVLKTDYAELYAVIGDAFGTASVNTKFVLPDLREATTKGAGLTGKTVGNHLDADGLAVGEFLDDRVQTHEHYIGDSTTPEHLGYSDRDGQNAGIGNRTVDATIESDRKWIALGQTNVGIARSGRYGATTEVKSVGVNYIIKAKMVALPADFISAVDEAIDENAKSPVSVSNKLVTESDLNTVTSGNATRNTTYVSSTGFNATWNKAGRVCMASLTFNLAQNTISTEEVITGFPAPIADVNIVAQGANNTAVSNLVLKTNGNIRTHYGGTANQFYQVTFTYITAS